MRLAENGGCHKNRPVREIFYSLPRIINLSEIVQMHKILFDEQDFPFNKILHSS